MGSPHPRTRRRYRSRPSRHQTAQAVRRIIAANTILIGIHFQNVPTRFESFSSDSLHPINRAHQSQMNGHGGRLPDALLRDERRFKLARISHG